MHTSYVFPVPINEKLAENTVHVNLLGIFTDKGDSIAILSDNRADFKNTVLNETCEQLGIKRLFSNLFNPQDYSRIKNVDNFVKRTLAKFLKFSYL